MGAGWARMNDLIIIQTSQVMCLMNSERILILNVTVSYKGLAAYVSDTIPNAKDRGIVIGHDHRHNSEKWAELVAMVFLNSGFKVYLHKGLVHTPLCVLSLSESMSTEHFPYSVPFSVSKLKASCGVMITGED